ncbi:MAG: CAP domain-containing protein [Thermoanaerobaculales bacterium]|nr:CAP domain-containing protein [Thermoanaerobaculales bacterium]
MAAKYTTSAPLNPEDFDLAEQVGAEWPDFVYSASLARAAKGYAAASKFDPTHTPPSDVLRRVLHEAGVPENSAVAAIVATTEDGASDALDHLRSIMPSSGSPTHIGLGRSPAALPPFKWQWAILLIERRLDLVSSVPRQVKIGGVIPLHFNLRRDFTKPRILVQHPDGRTHRMIPAVRSEGWYTVVPLGRDQGMSLLQILAENEVGAQVVAQISIQIGSSETPANRRHLESSNHEESVLMTPGEAEAFMLNLINAERIDHGLGVLEWNPSLAHIARAHSRDIVQNDFFGHRSPGHGGLRERLSAGGYLASGFRENLARDPLLRSAHESLMASPGHRANILASDVSQIGVGVAAQTKNGMPLHWIVTEIFVAN